MLNQEKPQLPYKFQEFPKIVYNHKSGEMLKVGSAEEQKAAEKKGFQADPSPRHDYSAAVGAKAPLKEEFKKDPEPAPKPAAPPMAVPPAPPIK